MTPVLEQYKKIKARHQNALLFFRLGDFYEMFYDDAIVGARELDIALTARNKGREYETPMCGVPVKAVDGYVAKLVKKGYRVAICEQLGDPALSKGPVERDVVRVVTPGTVVEQEILDEKDNNFICAVSEVSGALGAAFADVSTGEFRVAECADAERMIELIHQFSPREFIHSEDRVPEVLEKQFAHVLKTTGPGWNFNSGNASEKLCSHYKVKTLSGFGLDGQHAAVSAAGGLLAYLEDTQRSGLQHLNPPVVFDVSGCLVLDPSTRRNLELFQPLMPDRKEGTLYALMDKTLTGMGARLLRNWMLRPLIVRDEIVSRLDGVGEMSLRSMTRDGISDKLKHVNDIERILGRMGTASVKPRDLIALKISLSVLPEVKELLSGFESSLLSIIFENLDELKDIHNLIESAIRDEPAVNPKEGGIIRDGYDAEIDELRSISSGGKTYIAGIEKRERERSGIEKLKVSYNRVFGYFIEVPRSKSDNVPEDYIRKQTLVNCERFVTEDLKEYESKVLGAEEKLSTLEYEVFCKVRDAISAESARLQRTAGALAATDVLASLSVSASIDNYCRPEIMDEGSIIITEGRHPVVEKLNTGPFIPNDTVIDCGENRIQIITGPNMGGKSTYLRQVALITLMAQMGSFVPASSASISIVDRIFTRVGASDNLVMGQSTFMVEMTETANILHNATRDSLVILDEVGRGTSTFDGVSLAWAVVEYLHQNRDIAAKTLFATHYHELTDLAGILPGVKNFTIAVKEWKDEIIFLHKVQEGAADKSYGIHVAELAGVPKQVIKRAKEILANLESNQFTREGIPRLGQGQGISVQKPQPTLFDAVNPVVEELKAINLDNMTPMEAMNRLHEIIEKLKNR